MAMTLEYVLVALNIFALTLLGLGTYLLIYLYCNDRDSPRLLYLIHLSVLGLFRSVISILSTPLMNMVQLTHAQIDLVFTLQDWIGVIGDGINVLHYVIIGYITIDRCLEIWLNLTYPVHCSIKRAKYLLLATWIVFAIAFLSILIREETQDVDLLYPNIIYVYACLDILLSILFSCSNGYLFHKYARAHRSDNLSRRHNSFAMNTHAKQSYVYIFRKSTFFISSVLILNFLVLRVIPDLVFIFVVVIPKDNNIQLLLVILVTVTLSDIIDGCIYTLNARVVKDLIMNVIHRKKRRQSAIPIEDTAF